MNLALTFCWREWRAQRGVLLAFTGMGLAALCLVFALLPEAWWLDQGRAALSLSWFVAVGVVGVVAFATPALVRSEFGTKDDQFVRRLPGALGPSFAGKLLFLVLVCAALPLVCLLAGEGFLLAIGRPWHDLFSWEHNGNVSLQWPWTVPMLGCAALLAPWVWAVGTWLPGGRMALGGAVLFTLLCGVAVFAVLRQSPGIEKGIAWQGWLWAVPVAGLFAAFVSWAVGRRGGGAWRSARFGLAAAAIGFVPPSVWFAERAWDYRHPDPQQLARFETWGLTPDLRYALATAAAHEDYCVVPFRIDLANGDAEQLGGIGMSFTPELGRPKPLGLWQRTRYWGCYDYDAWFARIGKFRVFDLQTATWLAESTAPKADVMRREVVAQLPQLRARPEHGARFYAPGGVEVWCEGNELCFGLAPDRVERVRWCDGEPPVTVRAIGHGLHAFYEVGVRFDLTTRRVMPAIDRAENVWLWRGTVLHTLRLQSRAWLRLDPGRSEARPVPALAHSEILGLLDDDRILCRRAPAHGNDMFVWQPADDSVARIALPVAPPRERGIGVASPMHQYGSLLPRDGAGRVWLQLWQPPATILMRLDPETLRVERLPYCSEDRGSFRLLAWLDDGTAFLAQELATIQRVDVATGAKTQLFPRPRGEAKR